LKDTIERVKAVDHAASIVDGILKQGQHATLNTGLTAQILSTCIFLGFEPDASLNIADRIRGPNVCYILFHDLPSFHIYFPFFIDCPFPFV